MTVLTHLTDGAWLRGFKQLARGSKNVVNTFLGIPYAKPPIGELRFAAPQQKELWSGERDATKLGPFCPQDLKAVREAYFPFPLADNMSEDCLYLNVWTPNCDVTARLPVMVWIYGGSFVQGCSDYFDGTAYAALQNVVFISLNFRTGPFGFMCSGDDRIRGNMSLLDILEALRWVQRHISNFGGDPSNITLFGESAGAISISALLTSPVISDPVKGTRLFHRAIQQSGTCLRIGTAWQPEAARKFLLKKITEMGGGSDIQSGHDIVKFLSTKSGAEILAAIPEGNNLVIDGVCLPEDTAIRYKAGRFANIDLMLGFNTNEGAYFVKKFISEQPTVTNEEACKFLKYLVFKKYYRKASDQQSIYDILHSEYLHGVTDSATLCQRLSDVYGDLLFISTIIDNAHFHSSAAKTYLYQLDHRPSFSQYPDWIIADHGNDLPFVIGEPFLERLPDVWGEEERRLSMDMMTYWANFARTGNPNGSGLKNWPHYRSTSQEYLTIRCPSHEVRSHYESRKMKIWTEQIYPLTAIKQSDSSRTSKL